MGGAGGRSGPLSAHLLPGMRVRPDRRAEASRADRGDVCCLVGLRDAPQNLTGRSSSGVGFPAGSLAGMLELLAPHSDGCPGFPVVGPAHSPASEPCCCGPWGLGLPPWGRPRAFEDVTRHCPHLHPLGAPSPDTPSCDTRSPSPDRASVSWEQSSPSSSLPSVPSGG